MMYSQFDSGDCLAFGCKADLSTGNAKMVVVIQKGEKNKVGVAIYENNEWKPRWVSTSQLLCSWDSYQKINFSTEEYFDEREEWAKKLRQLRGRYASLADRLRKKNIHSKMYVPVTDMPSGLILDSVALEKILSIIEG